MGMRVVGPDQVAARFRKVARNAEDVSEAWPKVGNVIASRVNRQFMTEGAYFGKKWKPLKPHYKLWKLRNGFGNKTLVQTGALKKSFTARPMDIEEYGPHDAKFGSSMDKAVWHHYGTHKDGKQINPPRKILVVTRELRADTKDILQRHIMKRS